jgi:MFS family permease
MNVLDTSIANVSLPAIAGDLGVSPNQGTWVITSFGVANAIARAAHRLAVAALRPGAAVRRQRPAVRARLLAVRPGAHMPR